MVGKSLDYKVGNFLVSYNRETSFFDVISPHDVCLGSFDSLWEACKYAVELNDNYILDYGN